jgi:hypothetical protein
VEWKITKNNNKLASDSRIQKEIKPQENNIATPNTSVVMRSLRKLKQKRTRHYDKKPIGTRRTNTKEEKRKI